MAPRVERFSGTADEWDSFVREQPAATHCHLHGWRTVLERVFGHQCVYLAARDASGALQGVLPLVRVRSVVFGHYLVSVPFLNYGGPVGTDEAVRALAIEASHLATRDRVKLLELRSRGPLPLGLPVSHRKITVVLDLPETPELLMKRFDAKLRSQVRRPQKEGVTVAFGPERRADFFRVFAHHMRDLGTPTQPLALFDAIADVFADDVWFGVAYLNGEPIAGGCGFRFRGEFEMTWASALRAFNRVSPNMLLYWACMERSIREGLTTFNFGRCSPGGGTHRFKQQWGARDEPLWWYTQAAAGGRASTPTPDDAAFSWGPRAWQRLPLPLATALGPWIVRYIP
jgi:FemAB-related protein (PEP-CTERM system-associated)